MTTNPLRGWAENQLERRQRRKDRLHGRTVRILAAIGGSFCVVVFVGSVGFAREAPDFILLWGPILVGSALGALELLHVAITGKGTGGLTLWP